MSTPRIVRLEPLLEVHYGDFDFKAHIPKDPVQFPHRYTRREDIEVIGFISAALAFGRVAAFEPHLARICEHLGEAPAELLKEASADPPSRDALAAVDAATAWKYRWLESNDLRAMLLGLGAALHQWGSLEESFRVHIPKKPTKKQKEAGVWVPLGAWLQSLRALALARHPDPEGRHRALAFLFPSTTGGAACKRQHMFLRWMVRPPKEGVDFGIWTVLTPAELIPPCDTHTARIGHALGMCNSADPSRTTADEMCRSLRLFDTEDPARFDFALAHLGISGGCRARYLSTTCDTCGLREVCQWWGRI